MVLGGAGWNRKEFLESNLHVCGKDDTKMTIYNPEECTEGGYIYIFWELLYNFCLEENHMKQIT